MTTPLKVLHLEDDVHDAALIQETLGVGGFSCSVTRVETEPAFVAALERGGYDLILADYTLPSFDGVRALTLVRETLRHTPFIFLSGTLAEDLAIEALRMGATDYVFKTRLSRLAPAVQRALREAGERTELVRAAEALRRSERSLAEAQQLSHTGSFGWNTVTGAIYWSRETFRIFDIDPATVVTLDLLLQRTHPADRAAFAELIGRLTSNPAPLDHGHRLLMCDGRVKHVQCLARPVIDESGHLAYSGAVRDITQRKRAERTVRRARIREVASRYNAMMEERTRVAREIHDTLLQGLAGITLMIGTAAREIPDPTQAATLTHVTELAEKTLREARNAVWDLRDSSRDSDLVASMRDEASTIAKEAALRFAFVTDGDPNCGDGNDEAHEVMRRVMREAMTNAVRHAQASRLMLRLSFRPHTVRLSVRDNGMGFTVNHDFQGYGAHWGLRGMSERAAHIGATLKVRSRRGVGTEVLLTIPRIRPTAKHRLKEALKD